jgi:hypothetical protein
MGVGASIAADASVVSVIDPVASCTTPCLAVSAWLPDRGRAGSKPWTEFETRAMGQEMRRREQGFHLSRRAEGAVSFPYLSPGMRFALNSLYDEAA